MENKYLIIKRNGANYTIIEGCKQKLFADVRLKHAKQLYLTNDEIVIYKKCEKNGKRKAKR